MKSTRISLLKKPGMIALLLLTGFGLISCGDGESDSGAGGATVASEGGEGGEEGGVGGDGTGGDGGDAGEGAGACRSINLARFNIKLVREITQSSAPADDKQLIIEALGADGDFYQFTTNDKKIEASCSSIECNPDTFVAEYEQAFGVTNMDCR